MCEQCGSRGPTTPSEYRDLCQTCLMRQFMADERRAAYADLSPSTFGFDPLDDDPYDCGKSPS